MSESTSKESEPRLKIAAALQAILQLADGSMESVPVPVPLPAAVIRILPRQPGAAVDAQRAFVEQWFRRGRSPDSVIRYAQDDALTVICLGRLCAKCHEPRSTYYVAKLAEGAPVDGQTAVYCEACYGAARSA